MIKITRYFRISVLVLLLTLPYGYVIGQSPDTGSEAESTTIGEKVDAAIDTTKTGAAKAKDITVEKSKQAWDKTKEGAYEAGEWTTDKSKKAWDATKSTAGTVGSKTKELFEDAKETVSGGDENTPAPVEEIETQSSE